MDKAKTKSNVAWMAALAALIVLSLVDVLFLSSCGNAERQETEQTAEQTATSTEQTDTSEAQVSDTASTAASSDSSAQQSSTATNGVDYLVLVNKTHELDPNWVNSIELVEATNQRGGTVTVESKALAAFEELQKELQSEGVIIDLNSCYRSRQKQQELVDQFTVEYGADYVEKYVAKAGYSEHETGLALDVIPIVNGVEMLTNDEMLAQTELWNTVHTTMPKYGFILRYLPNQESITGYEYEPWHLRYVGTPDAQKIADSGLTLEEYLGEA